jgi:hypothetical protein
MSRTPAPDEPITLQEACEIYFRGRIGVPALLAETRRGTLETWKVGRTRLTNLSKIKAMEESKCLERAPALSCGSIEMDDQRRQKQAPHKLPSP